MIRKSSGAGVGASLFLTVTDLYTFMPIGFAQIDLQPLADSDSKHLGDGIYTYPFLSEEEYDIVVTAEGYEDELISLSINEPLEDLMVRMTPIGRLPSLNCGGGLGRSTNGFPGSLGDLLLFGLPIGLFVWFGGRGMNNHGVE